MTECVRLADATFAKQHGLTSLFSVKWSAVAWCGGDREVAPVVAHPALKIAGLPAVLNRARYQ